MSVLVVHLAVKVLGSGYYPTMLVKRELHNMQQLLLLAELLQDWCTFLCFTTCLDGNLRV